MNSDDVDLKDFVEENEKVFEDEKKFKLSCTGEKSYEDFLSLTEVKKKVREYVVFMYEGEYFPGKILSLSR